MHTSTRVITAAATREGTGGLSGDAYAVHRLPGTDTIAAAVVDGIGHDTEVAEWAIIAAEVAARVAPRRTACTALLAAAELTHGRYRDHEPDGVAVLAVAEPGQPTAIAWIGDARAYAWDGTDLVAVTTDHGVGEWLRYNANGGPIEQLAACHDSWVRGTLALASFATVHQAETIAPLVILTSDGVHDQIERADLERLVVEHADEPQALADALVTAAEPGENGRRDDATAVVIKHA